MRRFKRIMAGLMCVSILLSSNGMTTLAATSDVELGNSKVESLIEEDEFIEETSTEEIAVEVTEEQDIVDVMEESAQLAEDKETLETTETAEVPKQDVTADEQEILSVENEEISKLDNVMINYLVVGKDYIESGENQQVLVGIMDEESVLTDARLIYTNTSANETYEVGIADVTDDGLRFELVMDESVKSGVYQIDEIQFFSGDKTKSIRLMDIGIDAKFGLEVKAEIAEPDLYMTDQEAAKETCEAVIVTKDGEEIEASDIGTAIDETGTQLLKKTDDGSFVVVLDPGHGGSDAGACSNGIVEKVVNLKIAKYCKATLDTYDGIVTYMTRSTDVYVGLEDRVAYAKSVGADVFISFHNNSGSSVAYGAEVYYPNPSYNANVHNFGKGLAATIQSYLVELGLYNRGIKSRDYSTAAGASQNLTYPDGSISDYYSVIRGSKAAGFPGVIIEHAFVSNGSDAAFLSSDENLRKLGVADAVAIAEYLGSTILPNTETRYNGIDYSAVYDPDYYINRYSDVKKKYKDNPLGALRHFVRFGMKEGRRASEDFYVKYYKNRYVDLRNKFGNDWSAYYRHYMNTGIEEKRDGKTKCSEIVGRVTKLDGVNYSAVFNYDYYIDNYVGVKHKFEGDDVAALEYFVNTGMKKGQQAKQSFDVMSYAFRYYDLRKEYKNDLKKYYLHYMKKGKKEGRDGSDLAKMKGGPTVYEGVNYKDVFNVGYYANKYESLYKKYGLDDEKYLKHFVTIGMKEGRRGCQNFYVKYYRNRYPDLRSTYGSNLKEYYLHYMKKGKKEGRDGKTSCDLIGYVTKYKGVDYKSVYNYNYYTEKYKDVVKKYGEDDAKVLEHFVLCGMKEGRQAKKSFDVTSYRYLYPDLRKDYRGDLPQYYLHYIKNGKKEGRIATGVTELQNPWTVYKDVDYSYVYDYYEFKEQYPTIAEKFGDDDYGQLEYFVKNILKLTSIMGENTTNVNQMVAYYNDHATYPEFYATSDAPTIKDFCQIYIEECKAEGVNATYAFCQAMKETGFMKFGGQVDISQFNFAGVGATDNGAAGASFSSVREGVRAQVQHLKAYASKEPLNNPCVDPRFHLVTRGTAPFVEWLGINENPYGKGWATSKNYGYSILADYVANLKKY